MNEIEQQIIEALLRNISEASINQINQINTQKLRDAIHTYRDFLGCIADRLHINMLISKEHENL
jgi:hypothetical protein